MTEVVRTTSGYTLLELVLVLAIMAMALAAVAPSLSAFAAGRKAENAARQFVGLTRFARSQAISDGMTYQIVVSPQEASWKLMVQEFEGDPFTEYTGPFGRVYVAPEGVEITADIPEVDGVKSIAFDPAGHCDVGVLHFVGKGSDVEVACDAPVDEYRIIKREAP